MNRHAYMILAHTGVEQLRTLITALDHPCNDIFVHIDKKAKFGPEALEGAAHKSALHFTDKRLSVHWGGVSIMHAELELLDKATSTGSYSYYHLLSGMDLPIKPQNTIHRFFEDNAGWEFLDMWWEMDEHTLRRVNYYTLFPEGSSEFYTNLPNKLAKEILRALGIRINKGVEFKESSQWFSITDGLARYVVEHRKQLEEMFRHTTMIDEIFLATLVWNSPFRDRIFNSGNRINKSCTANMRFIDWSRGSSIRHPWTFTKDDFELLSNSSALWARKFNSEIDGSIIQMVVEKLAGQESI